MSFVSRIQVHELRATRISVTTPPWDCDTSDAHVCQSLPTDADATNALSSLPGVHKSSLSDERLDGRGLPRPVAFEAGHGVDRADRVQVAPQPAPPPHPPITAGDRWSPSKTGRATSKPTAIQAAAKKAAGVLEESPQNHSGHAALSSRVEDLKASPSWALPLRLRRDSDTDNGRYRAAGPRRPIQASCIR